MAEQAASGRRRRARLAVVAVFVLSATIGACASGEQVADDTVPTSTTDQPPRRATFGAPGPDAVGGIDGVGAAATGPLATWVDPLGVRFGAAVPGSDPASLLALEDRAGSPVGVVRVFARWDTPFPTADHQAILDAGRPVHLSVRPRTDAGEVIAWADVASAEPGSAIHDRLVVWTETIAAHRHQVAFTFNHEPETRDSAANGTAEDYVAAWRRVVALLRQVDGGDQVATVFTVGRGAYASGEAERWYPGDDVVDIIGADAYNWFDCQGTDRPWIDPGELLAPAVAMADAHGKPLAIPEVASTEDANDPGRKAAWIQELADVLAEPEMTERVSFVAWFNVHDRNWPHCDWAYDSSDAAADAFAAAVTRFAP